MLDYGYYHADCMDYLPEFPDNYFDLAIVDPPYGIKKAFKASSRIVAYGDVKTVNDLKPTPEYFRQLFRVSKNQIVWGYNHLSDMLPPTKEFVFWYKHQPTISYSDGELAWTSFSKTAKCIDYPFFGAVGAEPVRIHPTQKPVYIYTWLLAHYAKPGDTILDTHVGSANSLIAAHRTGCKYVGFEIDAEYYRKSKKRLDDEIAQMNIYSLIGGEE